MRSKRHGRWDAMVEDDPLAGLINLFDLWMVFSIALLVSLVAYLKVPQAPGIPGLTPPAKAGANSAMETVLLHRAAKLPHYRASREEMSGEGVRLGTAYRLKSGEVVYVPEDPDHAPGGVLDADP